MCWVFMRFRLGLRPPAVFKRAAGQIHNHGAVRADCKNVIIFLFILSFGSNYGNMAT